MRNIVCYDSDGNHLDHYTQWDIGQELYISGADTSSTPFFHFLNARRKTSIVVPAKISGQLVSALVPDILLQNAIPIIVFISYDDSPTESTSEYSVRIPVLPKARPSGYITSGEVVQGDVVIADDLITNNPRIVLSAAQGVVLKGLIDNLDDDKVDAADLPAEVTEIIMQATESGELDGVIGEPGRGILEIIRTGGDGTPGTTDTFTIKYTDGTTSYFEVYNGKDGGKGDSGENGGYYTPIVSQIDSETIEFDFSPSDSGMPNIEPVQVNMPVNELTTVKWENVENKPFGEIDGDVVSIPEEYLPDCVVKSVNGVGPDESGNIQIEVSSEVVEGADAGYYTPSVLQTSETEIQFSFTASSEDMDDVSPVTVSLPRGKDGDPAETPQRGEDYWTPDDIAYIEEYIDQSVVNNIVVDEKLDSESSNPVQNKVVQAAIADINEKIGSSSVDNQIQSAISNITHPVTSVNGMTGDVMIAIDASPDITVESFIKPNSENPVQSKAIYTALSSKMSMYGGVIDNTFGLSAKNEFDDNRSLIKLGENDFAELAYLATGDNIENYVRAQRDGILINKLVEPVNDEQPATKLYVDQAISNISSGKTLAEHLQEEPMILTENLHYVNSYEDLPAPGVVGRIMFVKVSE